MGQSYIDRRWDGADFEKTSGAKSMAAIAMAVEDAGLTLDDLDGLITCQPADTEPSRPGHRDRTSRSLRLRGRIIGASGEWIQKQMA